MFENCCKFDKYSQKSLRRIVIYILLLSIILQAGCKTQTGASTSGQYFYRNQEKNFNAIGRVAFIELNNNTNYPEITSDITGELYLAMQKKQIFGLSVINQSDASWRMLQLDANSEYTKEQIQTIQQSLKCDAVLFGTITQFEPFPHLVIGLRMKLIDLRDGQVLWGIDHIWDNSDKTLEQAINNYLKQRRSDSSSLQGQLLNISSIEFIRFVSEQTAQTLEKM